MSNKQSDLNQAKEKKRKEAWEAKQAKKKEIEAQKEAELWELSNRIMDKMMEQLFKDPICRKTSRTIL